MPARKQWIAIIISLLIINAFILINRNNGFKYYPYKTFSELYTTDSTLFLKDIHFSNTSLDLDLSYPPLSNNWQLFVDNKYTQNITSTGSKISLPLSPHSHHYQINPVDSTKAFPVIIIADHTPSPANTFDNEFLYCNLSGPEVNPTPLDVWKIRATEFSKAETLFANQLLKTSIHISTTDDDITKTIKIGLFLRSLPNNPQGVPFSDVQRLSVVDQIKLAQQSKATLVCGNYAFMFRYLAYMYGLTTRSITYTGPDGNWHYGSHFMNEVYLRKQQQWSVVDASNNIFLPHDSSRFYNAVDIKKMTQVNGFTGKSYYDLDNNTITLQPYEMVKNKHEYYNLSDADIYYSHGDAKLESKFKLLYDFYIPQRDFDLYSDTKANNIFKLSIKTVFFVAFIVALICYTFFELKHYLRKKKFRKQEGSEQRGGPVPHKYKTSLK